MKLTIDDIRAVVQVAERSSFKKAADILGLTQPALSRRVAKAESYFHAALFERTTQRVDLSPIGKVFVSRAKTILNDLDRFDMEVKSLASGTNAVIELACLRTVAGGILPRLIRMFRQSYGRVRFDVREDNGVRVIERVAESEVEFGIAIALPQGPKLDFEPLVHDPFILSCSPDHHLWGEDPITWKEISEEEVSFLGGTSANQILLASILNKHDISMAWSDEVEFLSTQMGFVDEGIVAGVLPRLGLVSGKNPDLCARPLEAPSVHREIGIFTRPNWRPSAASSQFLDFLRGSFLPEYTRVTEVSPKRS